MNFKQLAGLCTALILLLPPAAQAETFVWKIANDTTQLFLGGTIHLLTENDYPLPTAYETAYQASALLVLETDLHTMQQPETQQMLLRMVTFTDGRTLQQVLKPATYQALEQHLATRHIPTTPFARYKPGMAAMMLEVIELQRLGYTAAGVDEYFGDKADSEGKPHGQLETIEEQLTFIAEMGQGWEDDLIRYTLRDLKELPSLMAAMKTAWRQGDTRRLRELALAPMQKDYPTVYQRLLVKRNQAWLPQIEQMLTTQEEELVLVGALHLIGEEGLLQQLATRGYTIEQLNEQ